MANSRRSVCETKYRSIEFKVLKQFYTNTKLCSGTNLFFRFDIRLMKEGRMKGQAFITLPSEDKAKKALRDVHGYILLGKPMVIVSLSRFYLLPHKFRGGVDML